jgi:hypothetical protein
MSPSSSVYNDDDDESCDEVSVRPDNEGCTAVGLQHAAEGLIAVLDEQQEINLTAAPLDVRNDRTPPPLDVDKITRNVMDKLGNGGCFSWNAYNASIKAIALCCEEVSFLVMSFVFLTMYDLFIKYSFVFLPYSSIIIQIGFHHPNLNSPSPRSNANDAVTARTFAVMDSETFLVHVEKNGFCVVHARKILKEKLDAFFNDDGKVAISGSSKKSINNFGRNFCRVLAAGIAYSGTKPKKATKKKSFFFLASKQHDKCVNDDPAWMTAFNTALDGLSPVLRQVLKLEKDVNVDYPHTPLKSVISNWKNKEPVGIWELVGYIGLETKIQKKRKAEEIASGTTEEDKAGESR